ncbi:hypothetical protein E2C01_015701 [Portunus trituberculatus]|uniref:Uncharacterized protein n=1 Tax=Portunus trituberculatus TaxID=210409 RepID=A0A5B7DMJ4_PORTR|nr:hypothetical protein [Portunus trituberculatus]
MSPTHMEHLYITTTTTTSKSLKSFSLTFIVDLHINLGHPTAHNHHLIELLLRQGAQHVAPLSGRQSNELLYGLHWPALADKMPGRGQRFTVLYSPEGVLGDMWQLQEWVLGVPECLHNVRGQLHAGLNGVKRREAGDAASVCQHDQLSHTRHHLLDQYGAAPAGWSSVFALGTVPPDGNHSGQCNHEDKSVEAKHPQRILLLHNPRGKCYTKVHCPRTIRIAIAIKVPLGILVSIAVNNQLNQ